MRQDAAFFGIAARPKLALAAIAHDLALLIFYSPAAWDRKLTQATGEIVAAEEHITGAESDKASKGIAARIEGWRGQLPERAADLWPWLTTQKQAALLELLAVLVAANVNAIQFRHEKRPPSSIARRRGEPACTDARP